MTAVHERGLICLHKKNKIVGLNFETKQSRIVDRGFICIFIEMRVLSLIRLTTGTILFVYMLIGCTRIKDLKDTREGTALNLSKQGLREIPDNVFDRTELTTLRLFGNQIDSISPRIGELVNLEKLYLGRNNLKTIPPEIKNLKKLKLLSLKNNEIDSLPNELGELENLEQLWLQVNQLEYLPDSISNLNKLEVLYLQFNSLYALPEELGSCSELRFLHLNRNNLSELPESMGKLSHLKELYLSGAGPLLLVPENFCDLRFLELLQIDRTTALPPCLYVKQANRLRIIF